MNRVPLYILAGGRSARFGRDKARAVLDGVPLITRVAAALESVALDVQVVAARAGEYDDLKLRTLTDARPGRGPLGGLATALKDRLARHGPGWLLLASCDLIDPPASWVKLLMDHAAEGAEVVAFRGEWIEPLLALYHTSLRPTVQRHLDENRLPMWRLCEAAEAVVMDLPDGQKRLRQANTPEELKESQLPPISSSLTPPPARRRLRGTGR